MKKIWEWVKSVNWLKILDSKEFMFLFPLGVFVADFIINPFRPLAIVATALWVIIFWRNYEKREE